MRPASRTLHGKRGSALLAVPAAMLLAAPMAPLADAQLPGGMSPEDIGRQIVRIFRHDVKEKEGVERVSPAR